MSALKVLSVFGTRPEAIKMAPVVRALDADPEIESRVCVTAQHRGMLDQVLEFFELQPDHDLDLMEGSQGLADVTGKVLNGVVKVIEKESPDLVLVHGDTNTTMSSALAAYYN
jgi:UDP-N-acetylglucosamine 2-epimerase (non-hydrolysing)